METLDITRRAFIGSVASMFCTSHMLHAAEREIEATRNKLFDVNAFLQNFPKAEAIPGICRVDPYLTEGAIYGLIHIRMIHYAANMTEKCCNEIIDCQWEILDAIRYLMKHPNVRMDHVFSEGIDEEHDIASHLKKQIDKKYTNWEEHAFLRWGADAVLYTEDNLEVFAAEKKSVHDYSETISSNKNSTLKEQIYCCEKRENVLLNIIRQKHTAINYTMYGASHNWRNNIDTWNKRHPRAPISLLELTPYAVSEYYETPETPIVTVQTSSQSHLQ